MMKLAIAFALLPSLAFAAADSTTISLFTPAQVAAKRAALINDAYGISTGVLPQNMPTVTQGVADPYNGGLGVPLARVDKYAFSNRPSTSLDNYDISAYFYTPVSANGQRVAYNPGHAQSCNWPSFTFGNDTSQWHDGEVIKGLLTAGYSVIATNMPGCGNIGPHQQLVANLGDKAIQYFVDPTIQVANYWDTHGGNGYYGIAGLSGGGFTTMAVMALDPRFIVGVDVAGNLMGTQFICPGNQNIGDSVNPPSSQAEQSVTGYWTLGSFVDQYLMGASGIGRTFTQIRNAKDDCCFGGLQWNGCLSGTYGVGWAQYLRDYMYRQIRTGTVPVTYNVIADPGPVVHQVSNPFAVNYIVSAMSNLRQPPAYKRFTR